MLEIERKFLVTNTTFIAEAISKKAIVQGFLNSHPNRTVRIRVKEKQGFITVKGKSNQEGTTRFEWEKEIPVKEAQALLQFCEEGIIKKTRYRVPLKNHIFEVDVFYEANEGLILAEVELTSEDEAFEKPKWLGKEVTGNIKYYNSQLSKQPYKTWKNE